MSNGIKKKFSWMIHSPHKKICSRVRLTRRKAIFFGLSIAVRLWYRIT